MTQILSSWRSQEERLKNYQALNQAAKTEPNVADMPKNDIKLQSLTRCNQQKSHLDIESVN